MHSFENRTVSISEFSLCVTSGARRTAVAELFRIFKMTLLEIFSILNNASIRRNICLNFRKFTRENKPLFWQKWTPDVFSYFRPPCLCPWEGHKYGVSILSSINLCVTLCQITRVRNTAQTWGLDRVLVYLSSIACYFLDFIHWMVFDFYFDGVTVKTGNISRFFWQMASPCMPPCPSALPTAG